MLLSDINIDLLKPFSNLPCQVVGHADCGQPYHIILGKTTAFGKVWWEVESSGVTVVIAAA